MKKTKIRKCILKEYLMHFRTQEEAEASCITMENLIKTLNEDFDIVIKINPYVMGNKNLFTVKSVFGLLERFSEGKYGLTIKTNNNQYADEVEIK